MRKYFLLSAIICCSIQLLGQTNVVSSKLERIKIYVNAAEVFRTAQVNLKKGNNEVVIRELSNQINSNSIIVGIPDGNTIMSTSFKNNYQVNQNEKIPGMQRLLDSQSFYRKKFIQVENKINVYNEETSLLRENKKIGGTAGVNIAELEKASAFYNKRLTFIFNEIADLNEEKNELRVKQNSITQQINDLRVQFPAPPNGEISVQINAENAGNAKISFSYITNGASWYPIYDARCDDLKKPIKLVHKANVRQMTGENWVNVKLEISTGNPNIGIEIPRLSPRYLDFNYMQARNAKLSNRAVSGNESYEAEPRSGYADYDGIDDAQFDKKDEVYKSNVSQRLQTSSSEVAIDYVIDIPYNLPSSNQYQLVTLNTYEIDATYTYFAVPKVDCSVYLTAMLTNWQQYNLMPGQVNLFYNNSFVGKTNLSPSAENDTLRLSLGKDPKIIVKRVNERDYTKTKYFGSSKKESLGYTIHINNTNNNNIEIEIVDQLPVSKNSEIVVEKINISNAEYLENEGKLTWKLSIKAGKTEKISVSYDVTSPKNRTVYGL